MTFVSFHVLIYNRFDHCDVNNFFRSRLTLIKNQSSHRNAEVTFVSFHVLIYNRFDHCDAIIFLSRLALIKNQSSHRDAEVTFVSIHVRRTDYARHLKVLYNASFVQSDYFDRAIKLCRDRYKVLSHFYDLICNPFLMKVKDRATKVSIESINGVLYHCLSKSAMYKQEKNLFQITLLEQPLPIK